MEGRVEKVNELLKLISSLDRNFFTDKDGFMSHFVIENKRVCYIDKYTRKIIRQFSECGRWNGFSNGGTLREFIRQLVVYIRKGKPRYKEYYFNNWGYSEESKKIIKDKMIEIGFLEYTKED